MKKKPLPSNPRRAPKKRKLKDTDEQPRPKKSWNSEPVFPAVIADLQEREKLGIKKYGQALHTHNGRNPLADAYQESLDQTLYLKQKLMEEASGDFLPITPWETPELRPVEHFPAPIAPPTTVIDFYPSEFGDLKPGKVIPVNGDPSKVKSDWFDDWMNRLRQSLFPLKKETVLEEAQRLVHGDRGVTYGHPFDDFSRTAGMVTAFLGKRLASPLTPEDVAKIMICVKLSRETNKPKRDNRVDAAGYIETLDQVVEERAKRGL